MKTIRTALVLLLCGPATLSLALGHPGSYIRDLKTENNRDLQQFWEPGFCQAQLDQCSATVSTQEISFTWPAIDDLLSGITGFFSDNDNDDDWDYDYEYEYVLEGLRRSVATFSGVDSAELSSALKTLATPSQPFNTELLEDAFNQLTSADLFAGFPQANLAMAGVFDNVLTVISFYLERAGDLVFATVREVRNLTQFLRVLSVPPIAFLGVVASVTNGLVAIANSLIRMYSADAGTDLSFCPSELIACSLEMIGRSLVITLTETIADLTGQEQNEWD